MRTATVLTGGLATLAVTSVVAYAIASPRAPAAAAVVRALADCAAVGTLGLAIVPALETGRRRAELAARAAGPLIAVSAASPRGGRAGSASARRRWYARSRPAAGVPRRWR